jgi:hypothetical protein
MANIAPPLTARPPWHGRPSERAKLTWRGEELRALAASAALLIRKISGG